MGAARAGRRFVCALVPVMLAAACERAPQLQGLQPPSAPPPAHTGAGSTPSGAPRSAAPPTPTERAPTAPEARVEVAADGHGKQRVEQAVADLARIGLLTRLTRGSYAIHVEVRPGGKGVPEDGHLAQALLSDHGGGSDNLCEIVIFPVALVRDLERWDDLYLLGALPRPPPRKRDFWAAVLAHELAHCMRWERGERFAMMWERRTLRLLRQG